MFNMTKDGFVLLAGGFTDKKFLKFKINYIEQWSQFFITETAEEQEKRIKLS